MTINSSFNFFLLSVTNYTNISKITKKDQNLRKNLFFSFLNSSKDALLSRSFKIVRHRRPQCDPPYPEEEYFLRSRGLTGGSPHLVLTLWDLDHDFGAATN